MVFKTPTKCYDADIHLRQVKETIYCVVATYLTISTIFLENDALTVLNFLRCIYEEKKHVPLGSITAQHLNLLMCDLKVC